MSLKSRLDPRSGFAAFVLGLLSLTAQPVFADDPPPLDTVFRSTGTMNGRNTISVSQEDWSQVVLLVRSVYPGADFGTCCYYALSWYNIYPPVYVPDPTLPCVTATCPLPLCPSDVPSYSIPSHAEWNSICNFILQFYPDADYPTLCAYVFDWFYMIEPSACCPDPLCVCPPACPCPPCPPPTCPTCCPAPACNAAYVPTDSDWESAVSYINQSIGACDYGTMLSFAYVWFNYLPPAWYTSIDSTPPVSGGAVVPSQDDWDACVGFLEAWFTNPDYATICYYALAWFNYLPPS